MDSSTLTNFDYVVITVLLSSSLFALYKGFIKTCLSFLGWIISLAGAYSLAPYLAPLIEKAVHNGVLVKIFSTALGYLISMIIAGIINNQIYKVTHNFTGGVLDRSLGLTFGFLRGGIIVCFVFYIISSVAALFVKVDPNSPKDSLAQFEWVKKSQSYVLLDLSTRYMIKLLPEKAKDEESKFIKDLKSTLPIDKDADQDKNISDPNLNTDSNTSPGSKDEKTEQFLQKNTIMDYFKTLIPKRFLQLQKFI